MEKQYKQLSFEERALLQTKLVLCWSPAAIAAGLRRARSTVTREMARIGWVPEPLVVLRGRPRVARPAPWRSCWACRPRRSTKPESSAKTMWAPNRAACFYARPVFSFPRFDLVFVALQRSSLLLLWSLSQAMNQAPGMVRVIANSKLTFDHRGNARGGPQIGPVTLRHRSLEKQTDRPLSLRGDQFRGTAQRKAHLQGTGPATAPVIPPAHHRTRIAPNPAALLVQRVARLQQSQCTSPPVLQKIGVPLRSGITILNLNTDSCIIYAGINSDHNSNTSNELTLLNFRPAYRLPCACRNRYKLPLRAGTQLGLASR